MTPVPRRWIAGAVLALCGATAVACSGQYGIRGRDAPPAPSASLVTELATTVSDLDASTRFFTTVLGARVQDDREAAGREVDDLMGASGTTFRLRGLRMGAERVVLMQFQAPASRPLPAVVRSDDGDFQHMAVVVRDIDLVWKRVVEAGSTAVSLGGPQKIPDDNPAAGGIRAFYFRDRDQRPLELIWYPTGRGEGRWHAETGPVVLGIDHTAIVVANTVRSRDFYVTLLGLTVRGESLNAGPAQAALSGVEGARVRITGLGGPTGPGVELLEYEVPGTGRRPPARAPADIGYWQVAIHVPDLDHTIAALRHAGVTMVSRTTVACDVCGADRRAIVVRDPDGHAVRVAGQ